jgi:hypothetical protein
MVHDLQRDDAVGIDWIEPHPSYAARYEEFQRLMVYGARVDYGACVATLRDLAECVSSE